MVTANPLFEKALAAEGISGQLANVARSIYMQESGGGKNTKTSNAGAHGGMQIIPATFQSVADKGWDINNPEQNARAGIRYLKQLDKMAGGDPALTAAGYYGGPGGMEKARKGVAVSDPRNPKAPNTLQYADQVVARMWGSEGRKSPSQPAPVAVAAAGVPGSVDPELAGMQASYQPQVVPMPAEVEQVAQAPVAPLGRQAENAWSEFQQSLVQRKKVQAESLAAYGKGAPVNPIREVDPAASFMPVQVAGTQADFRSFGKWGARV